MSRLSAVAAIVLLTAGSVLGLDAFNTFSGGQSLVPHLFFLQGGAQAVVGIASFSALAFLAFRNPSRGVIAATIVLLFISAWQTSKSSEILAEKYATCVVMRLSSVPAADIRFEDPVIEAAVAASGLDDAQLLTAFPENGRYEFSGRFGDRATLITVVLTAGTPLVFVRDDASKRP